ncbi:amino acid permease [Clostridium beijerinckii]|uniref:L-asparagine transporter-like permease n=1 Tax=Clostridium beijerinckii TaxID=1520 RepID=A0AAE5LQ24_CLOBE|nr:amino acid permease [Clostridium beijerinckii]NRT35546.1 L-asparagine transporter-like permease [Clostridium beijerinckii]NRT45026.1 L-asparagine transporter-like permease [Clostridium beijerinckii]NRZ20978.1 L-asparagine transporter-like permease [Clostridium beijerinckii]NSB14413.1 L-asparagine transporter-like permease [Clostridium beijerinckii]OOM33126.1 phenylalanine-specific permease [Clostridium beijerinckii]
MKKKDCVNSNVNNNDTTKNGLNAYSLAGIGIGGIIGAGFFLGSSLAISKAGPSVILAFILGGIIMSQVLGSMTSISINRPVKGSFRVYTEQYLGKFIGFLLGWVIFTSGILSLGSEAIATGIFLKYWMPNISSSVFALAALIIVIFINRLGTKYFGYIESLMAVIKIAIIIFFVILGILYISRNGITLKQNPFTSLTAFFPNKIPGFLQSMLIVIFTFAGISTVAMATSEVRKPCYEIPKATVLLTLGTVLLYVLSMFVIVSTVDWNLINTDVSPFVQSFNNIGYGWASTLINAAILVSTFSVMIGTYYGCVQILTSLAQAKEAPKILETSTERGFHKYSWLATGCISIVVVLIAFVLGSKLFNYLISSSSYFSFFNWTINLLTYITWMKYRDKSEIYDSPLIKGRLSAIITIIVIIILLIISLGVSDFRIGFYVAVSILLIISAFYKLISH